jgi:tyrosyl-tRNA synthetase
MDAKMGLATTIVAGFHGEDAAKNASEEFRRVFRERQSPEQAPLRKIERRPPQRLTALLMEWELAPSRSEAERLIKQGGIEIEGRRIDDVKEEMDLSKPRSFLVRAGKKKFLRVIVE